MGKGNNGGGHGERKKKSNPREKKKKLQHAKLNFVIQVEWKGRKSNTKKWNLFCCSVHSFKPNWWW